MAKEKKEQPKNDTEGTEQDNGTWYLTAEQAFEAYVGIRAFEQRGVGLPPVDAFRLLHLKNQLKPLAESFEAARNALVSTGESMGGSRYKLNDDALRDYEALCTDLVAMTGNRVSALSVYQAGGQLDSGTLARILPVLLPLPDDFVP